MKKIGHNVEEYLQKTPISIFADITLLDQISEKHGHILVKHVLIVGQKSRIAFILLIYFVKWLYLN